MLCGINSMLLVARFLQDTLVLHSMMIASVCCKFGRPTLYLLTSDILADIPRDKTEVESSVVNITGRHLEFIVPPDELLRSRASVEDGWHSSAYCTTGINVPTWIGHT